MSKMRTHYDNLMVSRNAPPEVISAAYRSLSMKYHPDRNAGDPRAERVMRLINASYSVLSDPEKRRTHDLWIAHQERVAGQQHAGAPDPKGRPVEDAKPSGVPTPKSALLGRHILRNWLGYGFLAFVAVMLLQEASPPAMSGLAPYSATPTSLEPATSQSELFAKQDTPTPTAMEPTYIRPTAAPNGKPWPTAAGYMEGYARLMDDGLSEITIDNSGNDADMYVKLVALENQQSSPVRHVLIPGYESFKIKDVRAGKYDARYLDLSDGSLSRSEDFSLEEIEEEMGTRFDKITLTLFTTPGGTMQTYPLNAAEF